MCRSLPEDWIDEETGLFLNEPKWQVVTRTCHGCVETERAKEFMSGRGTFIGLGPFDPTVPQDEDDD